MVGELLAQKDYVVETARDAGQLRKSDPDQLAYAVSRGMTIVTHNRDDFESLHRHYIATGQTHTGILIARQPRPYELAHRLVGLLDERTADEMRNQLLYI